MGNPKVTSGVITLKDQGGGVWGSVPYSQPTDGAGFLRFTSTRYIAEDAGLLDITVERYGGNVGALNADITQSDCNRSAGKYTPATIPVSFADGEIGEKTYQFDITTAPTDGPYWINLLLNIGPAVARHWWDNNSEIEVNNGIDVPTSDIANYYTVGPSGDWTTLVDACRNVQAPALVFVRGGTYADEDYLGDGNGINPQYSGTRSERIILSSYPGENVVVDADSSITDMTSQVPNNHAFYFRPARAFGLPLKWWTIKGLEIIHGAKGVYAQSGSGYHEGIIVEDCLIHDCGEPAGLNPAGVRCDETLYQATRGCYIHHIYEDMQLHTSVHDNNAGVHGYRNADSLVEDTTISFCSHNIYHKEPPLTGSGETGYIIRRNLFTDAYGAINLADNYGATQAAQSFINVDIYNNISEMPLMAIQNRGTFFSSSGLSIYNNNCPFGLDVGDTFGISTFLKTEVYNNLITPAPGSGITWERKDDWIEVADNPYDPADPQTWPNPADPSSTDVHEAGTVEYFDYNLHYPEFKMVLAQYSATEQQVISTLPQWRATTDKIIMPAAIAGQNSDILDPVYDVNYRATANLPSGRFGGIIGVPDSVQVGGNL